MDQLLILGAHPLEVIEAGEVWTGGMLSDHHAQVDVSNPALAILRCCVGKYTRKDYRFYKRTCMPASTETQAHDRMLY